jgi:phytoene synthase
MKVLPPPRRAAMFAIYAFCREIDDIADEPAPHADKLRRLEAWRREIDRLYEGRPEAPTARALLGPVREFALAKEDFLALIEGMEMDAGDALSLPTLDALEYYCDRVACAVGRLSVNVFGAPGATGIAVAYALGQALQLTNILRDLREDATRGRLYLPDELLDRHGIAARDPDAVLADAALPHLCDELAALAHRRFAEAEAAIARCPRRALRPATIMMHVYHRVLDRLEKRGWTRLDQPVALGKAEKLWIALRHGLI